MSKYAPVGTGLLAAMSPGVEFCGVMCRETTDRQPATRLRDHVMPDLETIERLLSLGDRYGWPWLLVIAGLVSGAIAARWAGRGISAGCKELLPEAKAILVSHRNLMETANDQIPKQTAILEGLAAGHKESRAILVSIDSHVRTLVPVPSSTPGEPCLTPS